MHRTALTSFAACFYGCAAVAQPITCPMTYKGHKLAVINVYDGPPTELASLVPDDGSGWKFGYPAASPQGFFLGCVYEGMKQEAVLSFHLPANVKACVLDGQGGVS